MVVEVNFNWPDALAKTEQLHLRDQQTGPEVR